MNKEAYNAYVVDKYRSCMNSLEPCVEVAQPKKCDPYDYPWAKKQKQEKEDTMCYSNRSIDIAVATQAAVDPNAEKRRYLRRRLDDIFYAKKADLKKQFGLVDDAAPASFTELQARLAAGKYTIDEKFKDRKDYQGGLGYIRWRDPAMKEDQAGYDTAKAALTKQYTLLNDSIAIVDPTDSLKEVQGLESWTFTA